MDNRLSFLKILLAHTLKTINKLSGDTKQLMVDQAARLQAEIATINVVKPKQKLNLKERFQNEQAN